MKCRLFWLPLISLFFLWQILYLPHLRDTPGWYGDETATFILSRNLFHGQPAMGSYWMTYWHCYLPYFPGYLWPTGLFAFLTGDDILGARFLNTLLALGIALLIYFQGRSRLGYLPAWFGAALFLSYDQNVINFRWVYPHNAVAFGFALTALFLLRPSRPANNWRAGAGLAIASMAHPLFVHGAIAAVFCRLKRPRAWVQMAILPSAVILITILSLIIYYWPKLWFFDDLSSLIAFYNESGEQNGGLKFFSNFWQFYFSDTFQIGSLAGALLCLRRRFYPLAIIFFVVSFLLLKNRSNLVLFYYQAVILSPILAMCWAAGIATLVHLVRGKFPARRLDRFCYLAAFCIPLSYVASDLPRVLSGQLLPRNQMLLTQSTTEVEYVADWLNGHTGPDDLVIANGNIAWLLKARTADLIQATLWRGLPTTFFDKGLKRERFRYPVDIASARYFVVGDVDTIWTLRQRNIYSVTGQITREKWNLVLSGRFYSVFENPRFSEKK